MVYHPEIHSYATTVNWSLERLFRVWSNKDTVHITQMKFYWHFHCGSGREILCYMIIIFHYWKGVGVVRRTHRWCWDSLRHMMCGTFPSHSYTKVYHLKCAAEGMQAHVTSRSLCLFDIHNSLSRRLKAVVKGRFLVYWQLGQSAGLSADWKGHEGRWRWRKHHTCATQLLTFNHFCWVLQILVKKLKAEKRFHLYQNYLV